MTRRTTLAVAIASALAVGWYSHQTAPLGNAQANTVQEQAVKPGAVPATPTVVARQLPDFVSLVESQGPAVVNISVTSSMENVAGQDMPPDVPEFFKRFGIPQPGNPGPMPDRGGVGSGFIITGDGFVLTNAHVVARAKEVTVKLTDKREFKAKVIGYDRKTDVALLKIEATNLPVVRLGSPAETKVGEWVVAIGSPFGFENTVTAGIVSAKSRDLPDEAYVPFLQTDVAVNPGNSGGPLFNMKGEVIGINSQIYSRSGGYQGVSFAIPIDVALTVKEQLQTSGKVTRGKIGVGIQPVTKELAESFGLKNTDGALIGNVEKGSPAEKAGLQSGDVVLALNGKRLERSIDLPRMVGLLKPNEKATLKVWHDGKEKEVDVTLGEMPSDIIAAMDTPNNIAPAKLGVSVRSLTDEERKKLDVTGGVLVEQVSGAAARAGIQTGDVILGVNNKSVGDPEQLKQVVDAAKGRVAVLVQRQNARIFVPVELG
ncbi:MAG: DegQ family serine endoprotease [Burkholderiales bacterium]